MNPDEMWLSNQGFKAEPVEAGPGLYWATLRSEGGTGTGWRRYGKGSTPEEAIRSARQRYEVEHVGDIREATAEIDRVVAAMLDAAVTIGPAWQEHLDFWEDEERGDYNDVGILVHHLIELVADNGEVEARSIFQVVEEAYASHPSRELTNLLTIGLIEGLIFSTSWPHTPIDSSALLPFLGPLTAEAWDGYLEEYG